MTDDEIRDAIGQRFLNASLSTREQVHSGAWALEIANALLPIVRAIAEAEYQRGHDDGWIAGQFDAEGIG